MRRKTQAQIIAELLAKHSPRVQQAFLEAVAEIRNRVTLRIIVERLERGDIPGAIDALNIERDAFSRVELAILEAYNSGGEAVVQSMPILRDPEGAPIVFRWGVRNLPAEQEMREHAATMVRGIAEDAQEGLRRVLTDGLARGYNPRATATAVVGRRNKASNQREGGYVGLTGAQMQTVEKVRQALAEGDVEGMKAYLSLTLRDKRFDRSVVKAIDEGRALQADLVAKVAGQYSARALDYRGRLIARHETMIALDKSKHDAFEQQIAAGKVDQQDITKTWKRTPTEHPRLQHIAMAGMTVPFGEHFIAPDGTQLRFPHDPAAPARHTIGCMCRVEYSIDYTAAALRRYRQRVA